VMAGEVISMQMGISMGAALAGNAELESPGVGQIQELLALFLYVAVGGHLVLLRGLAESLRSVPPGVAVSFPEAGGATVGMLGSMFACALSVAAPVMITLLLVNLALSVLSRAVPQLNAMMVSLPLTIGVGLVALATALPLLAATVAGWMDGLPGSVEHVLGAFHPVP
jgi:flagellar biosynthesis protein FliR